jgi:hypothetical protein
MKNNPNAQCTCKNLLFGVPFLGTILKLKYNYNYNYLVGLAWLQGMAIQLTDIYLLADMVCFMIL